MIRKISLFFELKATLTVTSTCQIMPSSLPPLGRQKNCNSCSRSNGCIQDEDTVQCRPSAFVFFALIYPLQALLSTFQLQITLVKGYLKFYYLQSIKCVIKNDINLKDTLTMKTRHATDVIFVCLEL